MRKLGRAGDIPRVEALNPLRDVVVQRAGPFANAVLSALQAARHLAGGLFGPERQVNFVKMAHALCGSQLVGLAAGRGRLHLLQFSTRRVHADGLGTMPGLRLQAGRALSARFRQVFQRGGRRQGEGIRRAIFDTGRAVWTRQTEIAFIRRGLHAAIVERSDDNLHRAKRAGHHAGLTADAFLLIHLYAVIAFADGAVRAALRAGCIFAMMTGHGVALLAGSQDRDTGMKMALAQGMLLTVVRHHAGDFAGATPNALLAVSHNKTIHNHTCFWFNNLSLYKSMVFTHHGAFGQCSNA